VNRLAGILAVQSAENERTSATDTRVAVVWGSADEDAKQSLGRLTQSFGGHLQVRQLAGAKRFFPEERPQIIVEEAARLWT
jgi:hypothetical protein